LEESARPYPPRKAHSSGQLCAVSISLSAATWGRRSRFATTHATSPRPVSFLTGPLCAGPSGSAASPAPAPAPTAVPGFLRAATPWATRWAALASRISTSRQRRRPSSRHTVCSKYPSWPASLPSARRPRRPSARQRWTAGRWGRMAGVVVAHGGQVAAL